LELTDNKGRYGLGYKPTKADKRRITEERVERGRARLEGRNPRIRGITLCDLKQSFHSAGWMNINHVAVIESRLRDESSSFVRPCLPDT